MAAPRWRLFGVLAVVALLVPAFMGWVVLGTPSRSVERLVNEKVVTSREGVELLWASGWLRENSNVYRCPKARLGMPVITGPGFNEVTGADLAEAGMPPNSDVKALLDRLVPGAIDWDRANVYTGEGDVLLTLITVVVPEKGPDAFVYMFVF